MITDPKRISLRIPGGPPNLTPAATTPPQAAGVPNIDTTPDDTAPEGHAAAIALAAMDRVSAEHRLGDALRLLEAAEGLTARAGVALSYIGAYDASRPAVDHLFVDVTRLKNELSGVVETLHNLGVTS